MEIVIMQKMTFYAIGTRTVLNCIIEPLKEGDQVYVVSEGGKVYKWDNTVTEITAEYLAHFSEVSVNDCPVLVNCSCSNSTVSFNDIVEKEAAELKIKYESNSKNQVKTESYLLDYFVGHFDMLPNNYEKVTLEDNIIDIAEWVINVNKDVVMHLIPKEYIDLQDNEVYFKQVLASVLTLSINDENVNKLLAITKAVKDYCDKLKAAKEGKKQQDNKDDKKPED